MMEHPMSPGPSSAISPTTPGFTNVLELVSPADPALSTGGTEEFVAGDFVWHVEEGTAHTVIDHASESEVVVAAVDGPPRRRTVSIGSLQRASAKLIEGNSAANLLSTAMGEHDLRHNVERRLAEGQVFTECGSSILYARPPAGSIPVGFFSAEVQRQYSSGTGQRPPHMYEAVNQAYLRCIRGPSKQAVLVSGSPSGGKSFLVREAIDFIVNRVPKDKEAASKDTPVSLKDQVRRSHLAIYIIPCSPLPP